MDENAATTTINTTNPYSKAGFFSKLFFIWIYPFLYAFDGDMQPSAVFTCTELDSSSFLGDSLQNEWQKELRCKGGTAPSLLRAIIRMFAGSLVFMSFLCFFYECCVKVSQCILICWMLQSMSEVDTNWTAIYCYTTAVIFCSAIFIICSHTYFFQMQHIGLQMKIACSQLLYEKHFRLHRDSVIKTSSGQLTNLVSNDVSRFESSLLFVPYLLVAPLQTVITLIILWSYIEYSAFAGVSLLLLYIPFQAFVGSLISKFRLESALISDKRIHLFQEVISSIRAIKMYCFEKPLLQLIYALRKDEINILKKTAVFRAINMALFFVSSKIMVFFTLLAYVSTSGHFSAPIVFLIFSLFNNIRTSQTLFFPYAFGHLSESLVSISRIQNFLELKEVEEKISGNASVDEIELKVKVKLKEDLTITAKRGDLVIIKGDVGSGKTSLLLTILGERSDDSYTVNVRGVVSYASQESHCFSGSVKENIVFANNFDEIRYEKVLECCALDKDIRTFSQNDATSIDSLSGGQRSRVSLARALYHKADIYLLDDPFSSVDTIVGNHLFRKIIKELIVDKLVILVTHDTRFIQFASSMILIEDQKIIEFTRFENEHNTHRRETEKQINLIHMPLVSPIAVIKTDLICGQDFESNSKVSVKLKTYAKFITLGNSAIFVIFTFLATLLTQMSFNASDYWLAVWTRSRLCRPMVTVESHLKNDTFTFALKCNSNGDTQIRNVTIYCVLISGLFIFSLIRTILFFRVFINSSIKVHNCFLDTTVHTHISFFDRNPSGILLNRYSRDLGIIDDLLPPTAYDAFEISFNLLGTLFLLTLLNACNVTVLLLLLFIFVQLRRKYLPIVRFLKQLEAKSRSPLLSSLSSSVHTLPTIRCFNAENYLRKKFEVIHDKYTAVSFWYLSTARCFGFLIDCIAFVSISVIIAIAVFTLQKENSSEFGLIICMSISLCGLCEWGVRQSTEVDTQLLSFERLYECLIFPFENIHECTVTQALKSQWPQKAQISFYNVSVQYNPNDKFAIKNACFDIKGKEKIGIVGRTGSGKSSIVNALFRLVSSSGLILIDGVDIKTIDLHTLRSKMSIIPQQPVLFSETLRFNFDPFNEYSDEELSKVLREIQLDDKISKIGGMNTIVGDAANNFSAGEKQLISLGRALLKNNKILILDEATANIDFRTDVLLQKIMKKRFAECTVITIAHRLQTIMDSERVLVIDDGIVCEFDNPYVLLDNENSVFSCLVNNTNPKQI